MVRLKGARETRSCQLVAPFTVSIHIPAWDTTALVAMIMHV